MVHEVFISTVREHHILTLVSVLIPCGRKASLCVQSLASFFCIDHFMNLLKWCWEGFTHYCVKCVHVYVHFQHLKNDCFFSSRLFCILSAPNSNASSPTWLEAVRVASSRSLMTLCMCLRRLAPILPVSQHGDVAFRNESLAANSDSSCIAVHNSSCSQHRVTVTAHDC